jgi:chromosome segregation ATPase
MESDAIKQEKEAIAKLRAEREAIMASINRERISEEEAIERAKKASSDLSSITESVKTISTTQEEEKKKLSDIRSQVSGTESILLGLERQVLAAQDDGKRVVAEYEGRRKALEQSVQELQKTVEALSRENESAVEAGKSRIAVLYNEEKKIAASILSKKHEVEVKEEKIIDLNVKEAEARKALEQRDGEIKERWAEVERARGEREEIKKQVATLKGELAEIPKKIAEEKKAMADAIAGKEKEEEELRNLTALRIRIVEREQTLNDRERFLKEKYQLAGIPW